MALLTSAPASAIITDSNVLTLSWTPIADTNGLFSRYLDWVITVDATPFTVLPVWLNPPTDTLLGTQTFTQTLGGGGHTLTMQAFEAASGPVALTLPWETSGTPAARAFPGVLTTTDVQLSLSSVELGQTLTVTLNPIYTTADQWQIIWPDNTTTGWLPLSSNVVAKSFTVPGAQNIIVQSRRDYSGAQFDPPASLIRQTSVQIFVVDQQFTGTSSAQGGLTGDLGIGGPQGFEITDASSVVVVPNSWEVIARGIVRDTITNELKLLVATTRFSNASSLFGTMAIDVFPITGRPHSIELIKPIFELEVTNTSTSPVKVATTTLPTLIVGKSVSQALGGTFALTTKANTGVAPFLWNSTGLPSGVTMSSNGVLTGVPLELGTFTVVFAVQDSDIPFSIDETALPLTVATDLAVQIATGQKDANNTTLSPLGKTLGVAQVLKPYSVQMQVGNTNPNATSAGGLPPYTWTIPAGALPVGLTIDPNTGVISGVPCTYNSTSDFSKTFTAIIQIEDAIGAKATQTYTMTLESAPLQFSLTTDQGTIYSAQDFKLVASIFGGQSPYTFDSFQVSPSEVSYYTVPPSAIVDGQIEIVADVPTTGTGTRTFTLTAHDSLATSKSQAISYQVENEISDVRMVPAFFNHYWAAGDKAAAPAISIVGNLSGYTLAGATITLSAAANHIGGTTVYTGSVGSGFAGFVGKIFTVQGFTNPLNNGVFLCSAANSTTLTLNNSAGALETNPAKAITDLVPSLSNGIGLALDPTVPQITATGPASVFSNAQLRIPLQLSQSNVPVAAISREYTFLAHNDTASPGDIGTISTFPHPYIVGDPVFLNPRKPYFNSINIVGWQTISTPTNLARVQNGSSLPPGLSFDANTSLIYGKLAGLATSNSVIEYIDGGGTVHGTITIVWLTYKNDFPLLDSFATADQQQIGTPYTAPGVIVATAPSGITLSNPVVTYPKSGNNAVLPSGVSFVIDNSVSPSVVRITGTPAEAGYFDLWLQVSGNNSQLSTIFHRLAVDFTKPMVILTSSLPTISAQAYSTTLSGFGGIPPYTWSVDGWTGGTAPTGPFHGLAIATNADSTGTISGTLTGPPGSSPTDLDNIPIRLTDTRGAGSSVLKPLDLTYDNRLRLITPTVPSIVPDGSDFAFQMQAAGGVPPYTFELQTPGSPTANLPTGILFSSTNTFVGGTGAFSGSTTDSPYSSSFHILVQDSLSNTADGFNALGAPYLIQTAAAALTIDQSKVGAINRGVPYQGTLTIQNGTQNFVTPISWQVSPTPANPNTLLPGLSLNPDVSTSGVNAIISGTYQGIPHEVESIVKIVGNGVTATVTTKQAIGFVATNSVTIAGTTNFNGTTTVQSVAADHSSFTINSASATTESPANATATVTTNLYPVRVVAVDANNNAAYAIVTLNTSTDLAITTTSLPNATVGGSYNVQLTSIGGINPDTWSIDPLSATSSGALSAQGLTLSSGGLLSGSALSIFTDSITFRVTDSLGGTPNFARATFTLASQASGLTITTATITPATSGVAYSFTLQASGSPNTPYTWTIASGSLPSGLSLSSGGVISGTTTQSGFSQSITFRVTDSIAATVTKPLTLSVQTGLSLKTGIDFVDSTNTGILGFVAVGQVASINPRPNLSFFIVATGVISSSPSTMSVTTSSPNITGVVTSVSGGSAQIALSGIGFDSGILGSNSLTVTVNDNGVTATQTFTFVVYDDGILRIGATLPTESLTSGGGGGGFLPPFSFVQRAHYNPPALGGGQSTISFSFSQAASVGNTIVLSFDAFDFTAGSASISVTDNLGNTYNQVFHENDGEHDMFLYYAHVAHAGTPTITIHPLTGAHSNSFIQAASGEFSGFFQPETTDGKNGNMGLQSNPSFNTGTITTSNSQASDVVFSAVYNNNGNSTLPPGFMLVDQSTLDSLFGPSSFTANFYLAFRLFSTPTTVSPTWTSNSGNFNGIGITAAFKLNQ